MLAYSEKIRSICTINGTWNFNISSLSYSTCCCNKFNDAWKYQVTPNTITKLTTDSTKLTPSTLSLLTAPIIKLCVLTADYILGTFYSIKLKATTYYIITDNWISYPNTICYNKAKYLCYSN